MVGKRLGESPQEDHWTLRSTATDTVLLICRKYGASYHTLQPRVTRTLLRAFLDPEKPFTTHYGAILGLSRMGTEVFKTLVVPNLKTYSTVLEPELEDENMMEIDAEGMETPAMKSEAAHCQDALLVSQAAMCFIMLLPVVFILSLGRRFNRNLCICGCPLNYLDWPSRFNSERIRQGQNCHPSCCQLDHDRGCEGTSGGGYWRDAGTGNSEGGWHGGSSARDRGCH